MTDTVLQSFCERCGKRYSVPVQVEERAEPPPTGLGRFKRKARDPEPAIPTRDVEGAAVHFCLECRRYNCADCWNDEAGLCIGCRPHGTEAPATPPEPEARPDAPLARSWATARAAGPGSVDLDEWGRPRATPPDAPPSRGRTAAASAAAPSSDAPATIFGPADDPDPWRGVVFSADESAAGHGRGAGTSSPAPGWPPASPVGSTASTPPPAAQAGPPDTDGLAWPSADTRPSEPTAEPLETDERGLPAALTASGPHVDAAHWARASATVVGLGSVMHAQEPDGPEEWIDEHAIEIEPEMAAAADAVAPPEAEATAEPAPEETLEPAPAAPTEFEAAAAPEAIAEEAPAAPTEFLPETEPVPESLDDVPAVAVEAGSGPSPEPELDTDPWMALDGTGVEEAQVGIGSGPGAAVEPESDIAVEPEPDIAVEPALGSMLDAPVGPEGMAEAELPSAQQDELVAETGTVPSVADEPEPDFAGMAPVGEVDAELTLDEAASDTPTELDVLPQGAPDAPRATEAVARSWGEGADVLEAATMLEAAEALDAGEPAPEMALEPELEAAPELEAQLELEVEPGADAAALLAEPEEAVEAEPWPEVEAAPEIDAQPELEAEPEIEAQPVL
jgi:hypothetical protein